MEGRPSADILDLAAAAERSLRTLLPTASHPSAGAELRPEELVTELRREERISISVAADLHELFGLARRAREGATVRPEDERLARRALAGLESEMITPPIALAHRNAGDADETLVHPVPISGTHGRNHVIPIGSAIVVAFLLIAGAVFFMGRGEADSDFDQGMALFESGAYADAASYFFRYADEHPDEVAPHLYLARIHRRLDRPDLAAPELKEALRLAPEDAAVHRELGLFFMEAGRYDDAVQRFREALRLDPSSESAWVGLVQTLRASGQTEASDRILAQAPAKVQALLGGS